MQRIQSQNPSAVQSDTNQIIAQHESVCRAKAMSFAAANSGLDIDDLVQAGRIGLWKASRRFDPNRGAKLPTYAHKDMRAEMGKAASERSMFRRKSNRESSSRQETQRSVLDEEKCASTDLDPEESTQKREAINAVRRFIGSLPQRQKQVARLVYINGLDKSEAANKMGISRPAVTKLLSKVIGRGKHELSLFAT